MKRIIKVQIEVEVDDTSYDKITECYYKESSIGQEIATNLFLIVDFFAEVTITKEIE